MSSLHVETLHSICFSSHILFFCCSWRAKFGSKGYMNALHGSDGPDSAIRYVIIF